MKNIPRLNYCFLAVYDIDCKKKAGIEQLRGCELPGLGMGKLVFFRINNDFIVFNDFI